MHYFEANQIIQTMQSVIPWNAVVWFAGHLLPALNPASTVVGWNNYVRPEQRDHIKSEMNQTVQRGVANVR